LASIWRPLLLDDWSIKNVKCGDKTVYSRNDTDFDPLNLKVEQGGRLPSWIPSNKLDFFFDIFNSMDGECKVVDFRSSDTVKIECDQFISTKALPPKPLDKVENIVKSMTADGFILTVDETSMRMKELSKNGDCKINFTRGATTTTTTTTKKTTTTPKPTTTAEPNMKKEWNQYGNKLVNGKWIIDQVNRSKDDIIYNKSFVGLPPPNDPLTLKLKKEDKENLGFAFDIVNVINGGCEIVDYREKDKVKMKCGPFISTQIYPDQPYREVEEIIMDMVNKGFILTVDEEKLTMRELNKNGEAKIKLSRKN